MFLINHSFSCILIHHRIILLKVRIGWHCNICVIIELFIFWVFWCRSIVLNKVFTFFYWSILLIIVLIVINCRKFIWIISDRDSIWLVLTTILAKPPWWNIIEVVEVFVGNETWRLFYLLFDFRVRYFRILSNLKSRIINFAVHNCCNNLRFKSQSRIDQTVNRILPI